MTPEMKAVLEIIRAYAAEHGFSPSIREIVALRNLKSASGTLHVIDHLVREGHLVRAKEGRRNLRVVGDDLARYKTEELELEILRRSGGKHG